MRLRIRTPWSTVIVATTASGSVTSHCVRLTPPADARIANWVVLPMKKQMLSACTSAAGVSPSPR